MDSLNIAAKHAYFWSDLHAYHKKAAEMRGFADVEAMHDRLLYHTNRIPPEATLFILGDVSFGKPAQTLDFLREVKRRMVLVMGNHDMHMSGSCKAEFMLVSNLLRLKLDRTVDGHTTTVQEAVLCHYPLLSWNKMHYGSWMLHGHSHGNCTYPNRKAKIVDVGYDALGAKGPISWLDLQPIMASREVWAPDHHGASTCLD